MKRWGVLLCVLLLGGCCTTNPRKVAVLVVAETSDTSALTNDTEFWHDAVVTYCMLRENGFEEGDIFLLYGDGTDGYQIPTVFEGSATPVAPAPVYAPSEEGFCQNASLMPATGRITDFAMSLFVDVDAELHESDAGCRWNPRTGRFQCRDPVCSDEGGARGWRCAAKSVLDCLATGCDESEVRGIHDDFECPECPVQEIPKLRKCDYLFVWWKGHGSVSGNHDPDRFRLLVGGSYVDPDDLSSWMSEVEARHRTLVIDACHSGCVEELPSDLFASRGESAPAPIVLAASQCDEEANLYDRISFDESHLHGAWSYWVASTLRGAPFGFIIVKKDTNGDGNLDFPADIILSRGGPLKGAFDQSAHAVEVQVPGKHPVLKDPESLSTRTRIDVDEPGGGAD